jgi:hypothetical protein
MEPRNPETLWGALYIPDIEHFFFLIYYHIILFAICHIVKRMI